MVEAIKTDFRKASIDGKTMNMLQFVERVTFEPFAAQEQDVEKLRIDGFNDEDILDMVHITGYFNYINRVADALGVDLEDFMIQGREAARSGV